MGADKGSSSGSEDHVGGTAADKRLFVETVLYRYRAGIPWRDLPVRFGDWTNVHAAGAKAALLNGFSAI